MIIKTYKDLQDYFLAFSKGEISLLIIRSEGGLSKSFTAKQVLNGKNALFFKGHSTPLSIYLRVFKNPEHLICFDDVDSLVHNKVSVALLKQLCEIDDNKLIRYDSTVKVDGKVVPSHFDSNNKVLLLCNDFRRIGRNIKALLTRGIYIDFRPSITEILKVLSGLSSLNAEIFNFLEFHAESIKDFNIRLYFKLLELRRGGIDWKDYVRAEFSINQDKELAFEIRDFPSQQRNERWVAETGKSVRHLQRILKQLNDKTTC